MTRCAALVIASVLVLGCATTVTRTPARTATGTPLPTPTLAHAFVLRMDEHGGLTYPGDTVELPPRFTLYADGLAIYITFPVGGIEVHQARYSPDQIEALVDSALNDGGIAEAASSYPDASVSDAGWTRFQLHANGVDKTVSVHALGFEEGIHDTPIRRRLHALAERLGQVEGDVAAGRIEDLGPYEPPAYRLTLYDPIDGGGPVGRPWPWPRLDPDDFGPSEDHFGVFSTVISAADARLIADPPTSAPDNVVVTRPDGTRYLIRLRALLPDEIPAAFGE